MDDPLEQVAATLADGIHHVVLADGRRAVVKRRRAAPEGFFAAEARGLAALAASSAMRVPAVYARSDDTIVLEDLGRGRASAAGWRRAGEGLARLHSERSALFGFDHDGWCGVSPQVNTPMTDGHSFFVECRLLYQGRRAFDSGLLEQRDITALEHVCTTLRALVPVHPPVLVHGDLWIANLHACADAELALIDAGAVHYGWAETDLAMLTLFGEPPADFFAAYQSAAGVDASWRKRAGIYNLYHLLNHLNLFGTAYLAPVRASLAR